MPTGQHVVDAFKNLIRYGKTHHLKHGEDRGDGTPNQRQHRRRSPSHDPAQSSKLSQQAQALDLASSSAHAATIEMPIEEIREENPQFPSYKGLENFKLIGKMGDGAFSNVYKALDLKGSRKVAVKVVRKNELSVSQAGENHLNARFKKKPRVTERTNILKEVQIMRVTNHPSIVKLHSFTESADLYFLVLELMDGGELFHQIVKLTYFSENLSRHVILQVAHGIRYLHEERGVIHRDIKPENLLFNAIPILPSPNPTVHPYDEDKADEGIFIPGHGGGGVGRVKIADFGLSKIVWNEETMTPCGTVGYTAAEIVKDEKYSKSVDMWALGCVLYTILCGFPPFYDEKIDVLTEKVARGQYTFLSPWWDDVSVSAKDVVKHLLCVNPEQRYTIDEFLAHPWCNAAPAPPPPPTPFAYPLPIQSRPLDTPLLRGHGRTSPGVAALKEAFDITYAVHRMEEEGMRRRAAADPGNFLTGLDEDDENEDKDPTVNPSGAPGSMEFKGARGDEDVKWGRRTQRKRREGRGGVFELDIEGATLLGRRNLNNARNGQVGGGVPAPSKGRLEGFGSPMRVG